MVAGTRPRRERRSATVRLTRGGHRTAFCRERVDVLAGRSRLRTARSTPAVVGTVEGLNRPRRFLERLWRIKEFSMP